LALQIHLPHLSSDEFDEACMHNRQAKSRLNVIENEIEHLKEEQKKLVEQWQKERQSVSNVQSLKEKIEETKLDIDKAEKIYDLNK
jgi:ATP-dependent Clp protease ATP-binding subunit ClpB